jgi:hypothetical protein
MCERGKRRLVQAELAVERLVQIADAYDVGHTVPSKPLVRVCGR